MAVGTMPGVRAARRYVTTQNATAPAHANMHTMQAGRSTLQSSHRDVGAGEQARQLRSQLRHLPASLLAEQACGFGSEACPRSRDERVALQPKSSRDAHVCRRGTARAGSAVIMSELSER